jgi:hypothetical protein
LAFLGPGLRRRLASETCKRHCDVQVVWDETTIEVGKAEERLYVLHFLGRRLLEDGINLVRGHTKTFGGEHKAEILDHILVKLAFVRPDVQAVLSESAKDFFYVLPVGGEVVGEDEDVVQIDDDTIVKEILENVVHETLESGRNIGTWGSRADKRQNTIPEVFLLIFCLINCLHTSQNIFYLLYLGELDHQVAGYNFMNVLLKLKVIIHALIIFNKCIHDNSSFFVTIMYTL